MGNFNHNQQKLGYAYLLTPSGIKSKAILTAHFLERKAAEYAALKRELESISGPLDAAPEITELNRDAVHKLEKQIA